MDLLRNTQEEARKPEGVHMGVSIKQVRSHRRCMYVSYRKREFLRHFCPKHNFPPIYLIPRFCIEHFPDAGNLSQTHKLHSGINKLPSLPNCSHRSPLIPKHLPDPHRSPAVWPLQAVAVSAFLQPGGGVHAGVAELIAGLLDVLLQEVVTR